MITFPQLYARPTPAISFELFPPKTDAAAVQLDAVLPRLLDLNPSHFTVTYGAMGATQARTLEIAARLLRDHAQTSACHLTCVGASRARIDETLDEIYAHGIRNIVALRGDPPHGETAFRPAPDGPSHASELVRQIRRREAERGWERLGLAVAGYPEKHIEAPDRPTDLLHLRNKVAAGADCVITQLFFDNAHYWRFVADARALGIDVPIVPGLMPIQSAGQIRRIARMCGVTLPPSLERNLAARPEDGDSIAELGARHAASQAVELLERGAPGIHFYVLNRADQMESIMRELRDRLPTLAPGAA